MEFNQWKPSIFSFALENNANFPCTVIVCLICPLSLFLSFFCSQVAELNKRYWSQCCPYPAVHSAFFCMFFLQLLTKAGAQMLGDYGQVFQSFHRMYYFKLLITPFQESRNCHVNASFPVYIIQEPERVFRTSQRTWWKLMYFPRLGCKGWIHKWGLFFFLTNNFSFIFNLITCFSFQAHSEKWSL